MLGINNHVLTHIIQSNKRYWQTTQNLKFDNNGQNKT